MSIFDRLYFGKRLLDLFEEWRVMNVCRFVAPFKVNRFFDLQRIPSLSSVFDLGICLLKYLRADNSLLYFSYFFLCRPDLAQKDSLPISIMGNGFSLKVNIDCSCQGKSYNQGR